MCGDRITNLSNMNWYSEGCTSTSTRAAKYILILLPPTTKRINREFFLRNVFEYVENRHFFPSNHFGSLYRRYQRYRLFAALGGTEPKTKQRINSRLQSWNLPLHYRPRSKDISGSSADPPVSHYHKTLWCKHHGQVVNVRGSFRVREVFRVRMFPIERSWLQGLRTDVRRVVRSSSSNPRVVNWW